VVHLTTHAASDGRPLPEPIAALGVLASALERCPADQVAAPADTVGAGDAFVAGYLWQQRLGGTVTARLRAGVRSGGLAVRTRGDLEGQPRVPDIEWSSDGEPIR
jgi:2-dehydro-3-deoxygluconokinase